jgi:hypothetical protein
MKDAVSAQYRVLVRPHSRVDAALRQGNIVRLIQESAGISSDIHTLTTQVAKGAALINEVHRNVSALTAHSGLEADAFPSDELEPPATDSG